MEIAEEFSLTSTILGRHFQAVASIDFSAASVQFEMEKVRLLFEARLLIKSGFYTRHYSTHTHKLLRLAIDQAAQKMIKLLRP